MSAGRPTGDRRARAAPGRCRDLGQQPDDRLEQPVALGLGLARDRRRQLRHAPAQLRDRAARARIRTPAPSRAAAENGTFSDVVAQRLEERLVGHERLLRRAAGEHERAGLVRAGGRSPPPAASCRSPGRRSAAPRGRWCPARAPGLRLARSHRSSSSISSRSRPTNGAPARSAAPPAARSTAAALAPVRPPRADRAPGPQQALVRCHRLRRRRRPELLAQQRPQPLEHPQPLGDVALRPRAPPSAARSPTRGRARVDQAPGGPLDRGQLASRRGVRPARPITSSACSRMSSSSRRRGSSQLACDPGQQPAAGDIERNLRQRPGTACVPAVERLLGALDLERRRLEVDPDRRGQVEHQLVATEQRSPPERRAQPREQRPQRGVLRDGGTVAATARRSAPRDRPAGCG